MTIAPEPSASDVDKEIARLGDLSLTDLKVRWLELKGLPLPKFMRRSLMTQAVAHAIREAAHGGLDPKTRKRLETLVREIVPKGDKPKPRPNRIKTGTRLIREWHSQVHEVIVAADGFIWKGERYASLSVIARRITGTRWNGWLFFGLKKRQPSPSIGSSENVPPKKRGSSSASAAGKEAPTTADPKSATNPCRKRPGRRSARRMADG
ncbi:DUF2924 domain-containing protein [Bauldia litoralis]|uniref:DUF2924 domain-containing protein n=1 Tax=Bauldia litoralis TaxID=665467 RepID=UPI003263E66C